MKIIEPSEWREDLETFYQAADAYYAGELPRGQYKGTSGKFGSYAQKGEGVSMIRLRMPAGRVTRPKLKFIADSIRKYNVDFVHFTTCQAVQLHNLGLDAVKGIMAGTLDAGIVTVGGGGDFPRNTTCSPLSGLAGDEYFDVLPYAEVAGAYAMNFINAEKLPRKYKIGFSSSAANVTHATFRDLGFAANEDGTFDVYSAGGIGPNPRFGTKVGEHVPADEILYYIKAMWMVFREYGNHENRAKARSRYMVEAVGGPEKYQEIFAAKLQTVYATEDLRFTVKPQVVRKKGTGTIDHPRAIAQKQPGLYAVKWHPLGGNPDVTTLLNVLDELQLVKEGELRLAPDETAYIVNLTAAQAKKFLKITERDASATLFEESTACVGSTICQQGLRDSKGLLATAIEAVRAAGIADGALPQVQITGCPSSCATPQVAGLGLRGAAREKQSAFLLTVGGNPRQGEEKFAREVGTLFEKDIPAFLVKLGKTVAATGLGYDEWLAKNPTGVDEVAAEYL